MQRRRAKRAAVAPLGGLRGFGRRRICAAGSRIWLKRWLCFCKQRLQRGPCVDVPLLPELQSGAWPCPWRLVPAKGDSSLSVVRVGQVLQERALRQQYGVLASAPARQRAAGVGDLAVVSLKIILALRVR